MANRISREGIGGLSATDVRARQVEEALNAGMYGRDIKNATVGVDGITFRGKGGERFATVSPTSSTGEVIFNSDPTNRR